MGVATDRMYYIRQYSLITLYGIKNCDSVKKARRWLDSNDIDYRFHDFRAHGLDPTQLDAWLQELGWEALLNRRGTTWRRLPEVLRADMNAVSARKLMLDHPALIKRPLLHAHRVGTLLGFVEAEYRQYFFPRGKSQ